MPYIYGWIPKPGVSTRGCGKTGGMTWHLNKLKQEGKKILTNYDTTFTDMIMKARILKLMPPELYNCGMGASEVHLFMESRNSQDREQIMITYVISQLRKRRVEFHWDSQAVHKVDKRLQDETDYLIHCENLGCGEIDCVNQSCGIKTCGIFHYEVIDKRLGKWLFEFWLNGPQDFYHLFDSEEIVMDFVGDEPEDE